jgi:hypothetical protein
MDDPNYYEFYAAAIRMAEILALPKNESFDRKPGELMEISEFNDPMRIETEDGTVIYERKAREDP